MFNCLVAVFAIIGNFIGAGFASGKEIVTFFSRFGKISFLTIILSFFCVYFLIKKIKLKSQFSRNIPLNIPNNFLINIFVLFECKR